MYKVIIIPIILLSTSVFASSYYNNFYSDFHNSSRTFTDNSEMFEKDFLSPDELNLPWINALVRIPKNDGGVFRSSIRELDNNEKILKNKYKTIIYLHGCAGHWSGTAKRIDFFAKNGYAVIAPPSLARKKYAQSCDTTKSRGGMYRKVLKIRQIDAEYAVLRAKKLNWTDSDNIFLVGLSEGGITTATYNPENPKQILKSYLSKDFDSSFTSRSKQGFIFDLEGWVYSNMALISQTLDEGSIINNMRSNFLNYFSYNKTRINANRIWRAFVLEYYLSNIKIQSLQ